jgi:soluble lytic murein transglycosylase
MLGQQLPPRQRKNNRRKRLCLVFSSGLILLTLGSLTFVAVQGGYLTAFWQRNGQLEELDRPKAILTLVSLSAKERESLLKQLATAKEASRDRQMARYLLAVDLLEQNQPQSALTYLKNLERDYSLLAPQILFKRAKAYQANHQQAEAEKVYHQLIKEYSDSPVVAEALYILSQTYPQYQKQLIERFPAHPHTQTIIQKLLKQDPDRQDLLLLLVKHTRGKGLNTIRDRLVLEYSSELTAEDWEAIANGYWREGEYRKAADAYSFARLTPRNLYRAGRGYHLNDNIPQAKRAYQRLIREFHDARETSVALQYLASISSGDEALIYLDMVIAKFPEEAAQAVLAKAVIYDALKRPEMANQLRQKLIQDYPNAPATREYRWQTAQKLAAQSQIEAAWQWTAPIVATHPDLEFAPKAIFWAGKWADQLGKEEEAQAAFQKVINFYPQSYYAWRAAIMLGLNVGNFTNLRQIKPTLEFSFPNGILPVASDALQELFLLHQYEDAWMLLQGEINNPQELTVAEQFTEGLLLVLLGENRAGIQEIWDLAYRKEPQERKQWQMLRKKAIYWYGLFPFPYQQPILNYAQKQEINPLLVIAVIRKESTFQANINSHAGAVGLMQIVPKTADWVAQQINLKNYDLKKLEDNINIGTWYLAHNHERYKNNSLLAIASYNAGTGNVNYWLNKYGLDDPDAFVEKIPFPETKDYIEGVFSNYWNYLRLYNPEVKQLMNNYQSTISN